MKRRPRGGDYRIAIVFLFSLFGIIMIFDEPMSLFTIFGGISWIIIGLLFYFGIGLVSKLYTEYEE